jgi:hypothetical protein
VLLRLAYLGVTNTLAMLRLLPMSDRAKDAEILAVRHQIMSRSRGQVDIRRVTEAADVESSGHLFDGLPSRTRRGGSWPTSGTTCWSPPWTPPGAGMITRGRADPPGQGHQMHPGSG